MKKKLIAITILAVFALQVNGQTQRDKFQAGFNLNQFHRDYGMGVHFISPYFLKSKVAVRAGANLQWFEHVQSNEVTWTTYQNFQLGIRARNTVLENKIFIYGEGGIMAILPNSDFSSQSVEFGGYGVFGFEFQSVSRMAYFIELGGAGTGSKADKLLNNPIYSNGFLTSVGFRIKL